MGMSNNSSLFQDTLLDKTDEPMKLHARFNDIKIGEKKENILPLFFSIFCFEIYDGSISVHFRVRHGSAIDLRKHVIQY